MRYASSSKLLSASACSALLHSIGLCRSLKNGIARVCTAPDRLGKQTRLRMRARVRTMKRAHAHRRFRLWPVTAQRSVRRRLLACADRTLGGMCRSAAVLSEDVTAYPQPRPYAPTNRELYDGVTKAFFVLATNRLQRKMRRLPEASLRKRFRPSKRARPCKPCKA